MSLSESTWFFGQPRVSTQKVRGIQAGYWNTVLASRTGSERGEGRRNRATRRLWSCRARWLGCSASLGGDRVQDVHAGGPVGREQRRDEAGAAAMRTMAITEPDGIRNAANPSSRSAGTMPQPPSRPTASPSSRAEQRDDRRLPPDRGAHLPPAHADGPQQAELAGALEHRQGDGVGDAEQGDDDGQRTAAPTISIRIGSNWARSCP